MFESPAQDSVLKLIDFGLSRKFVAGERSQTMVGTPYYLAPEILHGHSYGLPCDIWGIGVITYILLCGKPPFNGMTNTAILFKVAKGRFTFHHPVWTQISDQAKVFIRYLLAFNPKKRPTIRQVLQHPWLSDLESNPSRPLDQDIVASITVRGQGEQGWGGRTSALRSLPRTPFGPQVFSKDSMLKRAALEAVAFSLKPAKLSELRNAFLSMDADHTGYLSGDEFRRALRSSGASDEQVDRMFQELDQVRPRPRGHSLCLSVPPSVSHSHTHTLPLLHRTARALCPTRSSSPPPCAAASS